MRRHARRKRETEKTDVDRAQLHAYSEKGREGDWHPAPPVFRSKREGKGEEGKRKRGGWQGPPRDASKWLSRLQPRRGGKGRLGAAFLTIV